MIRFRRLLDDAGIMPKCSADGVAEYFGLEEDLFDADYDIPDVSYADDLAFVIMSRAAQLVENTRHVGWPHTL